MLNLTVAPPGRFMEMSLVNAQRHKHIHMYVCRHIVWQTHQDRHHMQQEIHLHNFCVWPFRILCAWLGIILLISEWARWTGGARRQAHGQAVWIISLSRIQLYNELNLFCAACHAATRTAEHPPCSIGPMMFIIIMPTVLSSLMLLFSPVVFSSCRWLLSVTWKDMPLPSSFVPRFPFFLVNDLFSLNCCWAKWPPAHDFALPGAWLF